jgi:hypothetical protein
MEDDYVCDCDMCISGKCYDDTRLCAECLGFQKNQDQKEQNAVELFKHLDIDVHHMGKHYDENYFISMMDLYKILNDDIKLKEFLFKLKNKAFV